MKYEHWLEEDGDSFFPVDNASAYKVLLPGSTLCCTIEANSWTEAMTKFHEHKGWEPYRPLDEGANE